MSEPPAPRCLCIISGDPVRSAELLVALRTMAETHERLEIIVDRRRGESASVTDRPSADRRRQPSVDVQVKTDGFAIVPYPPLSLACPPLDEAGSDDPEFTRVLEFKRRRKVRRRKRLALTSLVGSTLVLLLLSQVPTMKALMSPTRAAAPPVEESPSAIAMSPPTAVWPESDRTLPSPESTPPAVEWTGRPRTKPAGSPPVRRAAKPVHAAPAPIVVESPPVAPPPSDGAGPAAQAATAAEAPAPRPQTDASTQRVGSVQSPELGRSPEAAPTGQAPTVTIPVTPPASSGDSPSNQRVGGLVDQAKNLGTVVSRDLSEASADMQRQGNDFKALQDRLRRAWDSVKQGFVGAAETIRE